ncbi:ABC transporter substrate-binding protein, partial [Caldimonas sp.]|uniref:ABC transporter substrate-binding protein n=1 Tax=Caldimonas sp. TaxID=2838790 RepID=UPI00391D95BD
ELGFKGGFVIIDQAKMDEIAKVTGGYGPLEGSIGVLPLVEDTRAHARDFVERFRKLNPGRDPSSEVSLNYTAVHATAQAMRLAGTVSDAKAIRAKLNEAFKALPDKYNPNDIEGVDEKGGSIANTYVAVVEGGKVRQVTLRELGSK